ncbi:MAG TPA: hypothetical protein VLT13_16700 [Bacteroidota bacterium]|nr:hypothetical protein [Bacteroidota bacterium]
MKKLGITGVSFLFLLALRMPSWAQNYETTWMSVGSLHNWYANYGCEKEEGRFLKQQDGLMWEAIYANQDIQAAKGMWIGTTNFTDADGTVYPHKVISVGPRYSGGNVFIPQKFELVSRFEPPVVTVDGVVSYGKLVDVKRVDPTITGDRMIINEVKTSIGLDMIRKIYQFSQQYHDNYIISDYRFVNTSGKRLDSVMVYFQYRLAVCATARYVIGNATGWGINTMCDVRGDGLKNDPDDAVNIPGVYTAPHMRIQYVWHGKYPGFTSYDNVGGPIWTPAAKSLYGDDRDTVGRVGASQFAGILTLHADKSASDSTDDLNQPSTTSHEGSDEPLTNPDADMFNPARMTAKWQWMRKGHYLRHADRVEPAGAFSTPTGDPALGSPGGFSNANGYGPYTLEPGQDFRIVLAEGVSGLDREHQISVGRAYKANPVPAQAKIKNEAVLTGKDSLFQTFRRALANFKSGHQLAPVPLPPKSFTVTSQGDKVGLEWEVYNASDPTIKNFRIYRTQGRYDGDYTLLAELPSTARSYADVTAGRGPAYYYYIVVVGDAALNTGTGLIPAGVALTSSRYYTQTYDPAYLKRQAGDQDTSKSWGPDGKSTWTMNDIRIVPNPYSISSTAATLRFDQEPDKIAFFNIPGYCKIRIYTELGELIKEIDHNDGSGDAYWNSITSSNQVIVSGIYIVVFENTATGERVIKKLSVIR